MQMGINPFKNFFKESFRNPERFPCSSQTVARKKHIAWVDLAKGICILMVVLRHHQFDTFNLPFLNPLRMPLYFVLSGMFFKDYGSSGQFVLKKLNNLILPFIFWLVAGCLLVSAIYMKNGEIRGPELILEFLVGRKIEVNSALWFLICLFFTGLIFYTLKSWLNGIWLIVGVLVVALIGNFLAFIDYKLPLWIDSACTAMPFFYLGWWLKNGFDILNRKNRKTELVIAFVLISASVTISYFFDEPHFNLAGNSTPYNPVLVYLNSILIVVGVLLLCKHIGWLPVVSYFGRFSIIVLCSHLLLNRLVVGFLKATQLPHFLILVLSPVVLILFCWLTIPIAKTYIPYFTAQKNLFERLKKRRATDDSTLIVEDTVE